MTQSKYQLSVRSKGEGDSVVLDLKNQGFGYGIGIKGSLGEQEISKAAPGVNFSELVEFWRYMATETTMMVEVGWPAVVLFTSLINGWGVEDGLGNDLQQVTTHVANLLAEKGESDSSLHQNMVNILANFDLAYLEDGLKKEIVF